MSYNNRGTMNRRDNNRRSNDFGGGGNRRSGGGNYFDNYSRPMNPWEGGMVPGRSGSSNMGQGDLLSQLTSPEAQLALASNLINKLINQSQSSVPSLLNLGTMGAGGGHHSSFNDNFGNTSRNFQDRRRGRMDQRRTEPYNKSGMNRRGGGSDRRYPNQNLGNKNRAGSDRKPFSPKKDEKDKKDKDAEKTNGDVKSESTDESKRKDDKKAEAAETEEKAPPLPVALLYCHVCCKNMWDEPSFSNHLKGRPHQLMMDGLSEKYKLKVDLLRHDMRLAEQQREMELERKERQGLKTFNHSREYCAMCDLNFYGHLVSHRKNVRHQKLKAFLHPKCSHCDKEFSTRLEWDDHRLSFAHLKKVAEFRRINKPNINDDEYDIDELICPENVNCGEMVSKEVPVMNQNPNDDDVAIELKEETLKEKEDLKKEKKEGEEGNDEPITEEGKEKEADVPQNIDCDPGTLPKYNSSVGIGKDLVVPISGFLCRICNRFIQDSIEQEIHCRTLYHYNNFCTVVRSKARVSARKYRDQDKGKKGETKKEEGKEVESKPEAEAGDDEGNWKRRKTSGEQTEQKMEVDDTTYLVKDEVKGDEEEEGKDDMSESVWEEIDSTLETLKSPDDNEEEEAEEESPKKTARGGKAATRGRRGGRRGK